MLRWCFEPECGSEKTSTLHKQDTLTGLRWSKNEMIVDDVVFFTLSKDLLHEERFQILYFRACVVD